MDQQAPHDLSELARLRQRVKDLETQLDKQGADSDHFRLCEQDILAILDASPEAIFLVEPDGAIIIANKALAKRLRLPLEAIKGINAFANYSPELAKKRWEYAQQVIATGQPVTFNDQRDELTFENCIYPVLNRKGEVTRLAVFSSDITRRAQAEKALQQSQSLLNETQKMTHAGGWEWDVANQTMTWTDETYRIHGLSPNEIPPGAPELIRLSLNCYNPEDQPVVREAFRCCAEQGRPYDLQFPFTAAGGRRLWIRTLATPVRDQERIIKVIGNIVDITDSKRAEDALRENEEKYRLLFESAGDAIFIHNKQAQILAANPMACKLLGYTNSELTSMTIDQVDTPEEAQHAPDRIARLMEIGHLTFETVHQRKNGSTIHIDVSARRITWEGQPAMMSICRDFTERKQVEEVLRENEEKYRALIEGLPDIVMRFDRAGRHLFVSDNVREVVDLPAPAFIGKTHHELGFLESQCRFWEESIQKVFESGTPFETEYAFESKHGPVIHNWRLLPEYDEYKKVRSVLSISQDITAHRKAEQDYQTLFREMLDGFALHEIICDAQEHPKDYRFLAVNPAFERMTDLKAETIVGRTVMEVMPETEPYWIETYGKVALTGEPAFFENYSAELKKHFEVTAFQPAPNQFACIFADITHRKQAEKEREKLQAQLSNALEMAHLGHWEYDVANDRFTFNDHFYKIFRITANQVGGYTMSSAEYARRFVHPDEIAVVGEENRKAIEADDPFFSRQLEHRILYADGTVGHIAVKFFIQKDTYGKTIRTYGVNQDITERRQSEEAVRVSEEKYRKLVNTAPYGIQLTDLSGKITFSNPAHHKIQGYADGELIGKYIWDLITDDIHREKSKSFYQKLVKEQPVPKVYFNRDRTKDGREIDVQINWDYIYNLNGEIEGIISIVSDITDHKKLQTQLQQTQKMEAIGSLAGGIAHDLNNILFPISGLSEMLLDDIPPDNPAHESLEQIHKSAQRGSDLVKQILAFSRQSNPRKLPLRIQPVLKEVMKLSRAAIPMNIEITSHIKPDCGMVSADPTQIHQVAMNLITNAYHAVEGCGGMIHIALKETAIGSSGEKEELSFNAVPGDLLAGEYACITVSDTGTGMDQALIDKIFDPYFTTKELGKGTGLGLSVVHGIVKEHGGDIRVYSEIGKGSAFHVYLPLLEESKEGKAAAAARKYPTGSESILLVDDEAPIVRMEQMMLERLGYRVTVRTSSRDALAVFKADPDHFDLVISDRGMPNMTGEQLAVELISIRPGIPIILCTGFSDEADLQRARDMGIKGFLMKPVATGDLAEMVRKVLDETAGNALASESGQADAITLSEKQSKGQDNG